MKRAISVASVLIVLAMGACVGDSSTSDAGNDATAVDSTTDVAVDVAKDGGADVVEAGACNLSHDWQAPSLLSGVNGTDNDEGAALTADELTIIWATNRPPGGGADFDLWVATRASIAQPFSNAALLVPYADGGVNTAADERDPSITGDGLNLFFHSSRSGYDIYQASRTSTSTAFGPAMNVASVNTPDLDTSPFILSDGSELFYTYDTPSYDGGALYEALPNDAGWSPAVITGTTFHDSTSVVSVDGLVLYFASDRTGTQGSSDIWMTTRANRSVGFDATGATAITSLNTTSTDRPAWISPDQCRIYIWSNRGGSFHVYVSTRLP